MSRPSEIGKNPKVVTNNQPNREVESGWWLQPAFVVGLVLFLFGGPMGYFSNNPKILYFVPIGLSLLMFFFTHRYVSKLESSQMKNKIPAEVSKQVEQGSKGTNNPNIVGNGNTVVYNQPSLPPTTPPAAGISPADQRKIVHALGRFAGQKVTVTLLSFPEDAHSFGLQVVSALQDSGWAVEINEIPFSGTSIYGVYFGATDQNKPELLALLDAFAKADIVMKKSASPGIPLIVPSDEHIGIAVCMIKKPAPLP